MNKILAVAAVTLVTVAITGAAHAGPNCATGARYSSAPTASVIKQARTSAPAKAKAQRLAQVPATALGGGDGDASAPVLRKKVVQAAPKIETPAVTTAPQVSSAPAQSSTDAGEEYTSVSGIAARLAALAAQQKAKDTATR